MKHSLSRTTFEAVIEHSTSEAQQQQQQHRIHSSSTNSSVNRQHSTTKSPVLQHRTHHVHPARPASSFMTETVTAPAADAAKPRDTQSPDITRTDGEVLDRRNSSDELDGYRSSCEESLRTGREDSSSCSSGRDSEGPATAQSPPTGTATATHEAHAHPHRHRAQRYRGRGSPVQSAARDEERQRLVAMSLDAEVAQVAAAAALTESTGATEPQPRSSRPASTTVTTTRTPAASPSPQSNPVAAPGAAREGGLRGVRTPSPTPITASTSTKTSLAMISVALNVESRSAEAVRRASAGNSPCSGPRPSAIEPGNGNTSMAMLLRVPVPVVTAAPEAAAPREDGGADPAAGLRSSTASRMSRSSSDDSGAVEASMESGQCGTATPHDRLPSCTSPHSVASGPATAVVSPTRHLSSPTSRPHPTPVSANVHRPGSPSPRPRTTSAAKPTAPLPLQAPVPVKAASIDLSLGSPTAAANAPVEAPKANSAVPLLPIAETAAPTSSSTPLQASAGGLVSPPPESTAHKLPTSRAAATAGEHVTHVADVTTRTSTNTRVPVHDASDVGSPSSPPPPPSQQQQQRGGLVGSPAAVDISSSSSVGGHHLSVTEGNAFLKHSGSRREEAFYNTIQPYQETLVREAVRQAPHTVEHWLHQHAGTPCAGASEAAAIAAAAAAVAAARSPLAPGLSSSPSDAYRRSSGGGSDDVDGVVADPDDVAALCEARWEAYQQYEAEDMSNLNILASAHLAEGAADGNATLLSPRKRNSGAAAADGSPITSPVSPTSPEHQVDKDLVELAARLWWTVRFRHFYRTSAAAYEVQRQAAEAAGLSPPSPSAWSLATTAAREAGANGGTAGSGSAVTHSRCSTPASQNPVPMPSATPSPPAQQHHHQHQPQQQLQTHVSNDSVVAAPPALPPSVFHASLDRSTAAGSNANGAATSMVLPPSVSGTATPCMVGSFGAPSPEGAASSAERQYAAQKHRALQLLAAFVPRYHGTRRLFVRDVLRCEKLGNAAAAAAAAAAAVPAAAVVPATVSGEGCNPLEPAGGVPTATVVDEKPASSTAVAAPQQQRIVRDADNDDEDDDGGAGGAGGDGKNICRMIMLEYVCYRFRRPCVMDIKMGSRQYGLHPSAEKKLSKERKAKLSTSARYGIRLAGYRRWNAEERRYNFRSKLQCRALSLNEVKSEISAFLLNNRELERVFRRQLQRLRVAFSQQTVFRFYTSSLLFVYDAEDPLATARVTMVDFAYTYESCELLKGGDPDADFAYDVGYLKAIDTLLSLLA